MQKNLPDREHSTGCEACVNACGHGAITMQPDKEGFILPVIDESKCVDCGLCEKKCPVLQIPQFEEIPHKVYAAYNLNKEQHQKSASGGIFSAFANYFYQLDNGVVCASAFDETMTLRFATSTNKEDLLKFRGSKYVQSKPGLIYKEIRKLLIANNEVFFIGTPCQVAGLRSFLGKDYANLFTVDLVCHGVPSPKLFAHYIKALGITDKQNFEDFYFRSQHDSAYYCHSAKFTGSRVYKVPYTQHSYISAYLKGWIHRESCYRCPFTGNHRQGDCTICDFWSILSGKKPFGRKTSMGVSMIMTNTVKGEKMFNQIKSQLYFEEKTFEDAIIDNHNLVRPDVRPQERDCMYNELTELSPEAFMQKYNCRLNVPTPLWKRAIRNLYRMLR